VDFVNDEYLVTTVGGEIFGVFAQFANIVYAGIGCAVNFKDIGGCALGNFDAQGADVAGFMGNTALTIEGFGQDAGHTRFTDSAGATEEKGVGYAAGIDCVLESATDMFLTGQFRKGLGTVFPGQDFIVRAVGQEIQPHRSSVAPIFHAGKGWGESC
jgi:hypothetical protein